MHASTESLLSHRDGQPLPASTRQHIDACPDCRQRIGQLEEMRRRLRALPASRAPDAALDGLLARAAARRRTRRWQRVATGGVAAAALLFIAVLLEDAGGTPGPDTFPTPLAENARGIDSGQALLQSRSRRLEQVLHALPEPPAVQRARSAGVQATLEDQLALIDFGLSQGDGSLDEQQRERLWAGRVALMESLVQLRYADYRRVALDTEP